MESIAGFQKTGRVTIGPGADLVEVTSSTGFRHTAIVFNPKYADHPAIGPALEVIKGFLEAPYVTGLLELSAHEPKSAAFVYPTGQVWSAYEVVRTMADLGGTVGTRAGLELMYAAGEILVEAAEAGEPNGVYSHGGLTPWRVMLKADGQVELMGYALPQVEILQFNANPNQIPGEDSFRYCPPERLESAREEVSADLFSLSLVAFEFMTGKPVYDGLVNDIRTQASRGEGSRRLFRFKDVLPNSVRDLLNRSLKAQPADRFPNGRAFLDGVQRALASGEATGASLMDVMNKVSKTQRRSGEELESSKTHSFTKADLAKLLADEDAEEVAAEVRRPVARRVTAWAPGADGPAPVESSRPAPAGARSPLRSPPPTAAPPAAPVEAPKPTPSAPPPRAAAPPADAGDSRWGRPDPGRRGRRPRTLRPEMDDDEPVDEPVVAAPEPSREQMQAALGRSADALLRRISSSDGGVRADRPERSADSVINAILSGSDPHRAQAMSEPAPNLTGSVDIPIGARRVPRRRLDESGDSPPLNQSADRPRPMPPAFGPRSTEPAPPPVAPPVSAEPRAPLRSPPRAAPPEQLDAPVRTAEPPRAEPPRAEPARAEPARAEPPRAEPPRTEPRAEPPRTEPRAEPPRTEPRAEPRPRAAEVPAAPPAVQESPLPAPPSVGSPTVTVSGTPGGVAGVSLRAPDTLGGGVSGKALVYAIKRGPDGPEFRTRLPGNANFAEAAAFLAATFVPLRADLQGRFFAGYRLGSEDGPLPGVTPVSTFPENSTLVLYSVPAREVWLAFVVESGGETTRLRAPVSTAIPVSTVVDYLAAWMRLAPGTWVLSLDGNVLSPHILVDEIATDKPLVLRLG